MNNNKVFEPDGKVNRSLFYNISQLILRPFFALYFRHEIFGQDNIPDDSGAVVATNHASNLDPPLIGLYLPRPLFTMAKKSLHEIPIFGWLIRTFYSFPIRRGVLDRTALNRAINIIETNNLLLMFPEGTRTSDGLIQEPRPGIGKIVYEANCSVIPAYVKGSYAAMPRGSWFPSPVKTSTHFGSPLEFDDVVESNHDNRKMSEVYTGISRNILEEIKEIKSSI